MQSIGRWAVSGHRSKGDWKPMNIRVCLITAIATLLHIANAGAVTVSGDVSWLIAPPAATGSGDLAFSNYAVLWTEQYDLSLPDPVSIDAIALQNNEIGLYTSNALDVQETWSGSLGPGIYNSFMLHAEMPSKKIDLTGSITFDTDIIGVIFDKTTLDATDSLFGAASTIYADVGGDRGFELKGKNNWFSISVDRRTLEYRTAVNKSINEVRILTLAGPTVTAVPISASVWLFGSGLLLLGWIGSRTT
jgi:hypothetical protein